ncbi:MAG TPA: sugar transferase, partial [Anaerolineae bacterium]
MATLSAIRAAPLRRRFLLSEYRLLALAVDLVCVNASVLFGLWLWTARAYSLGLPNPTFDLDFVNSRFTWFLLFSGLWLIAASLNGFYDLSVLSDARLGASRLFRISVLIVAAYLVLYFTARPNSLPRLVILYLGVSQFALILGWRFAFARLIEAGLLAQRTLIIGTTSSGDLIARAIREHLDAHYEIVGFVGLSGDKAFADAPVLGPYTDLERLATQMRVSTIVLALNETIPPELFRGILDCQEEGLQVVPMPVLFEQITGRVPVEHIGENWYVTLPLEHASIGGIYPLLKRALDIIVAGVGLIIFAVLFPFISLAIKLDSPGALFYKQTRVGRRGKVFTAWKLRSMAADAEKGEAVWATKNDPRITRVGRILRKTRI